jgi:hypothetical protein
MQVASYADKVGGRFKRGRGWKVNIFGQNSDVPTEDLQAFRIDMSAHMVLDPHLHIVDQFQVFIDGAGKIGPNRAEIVTAHYADHHTAYGPLVAGPQGMSYLTLRPKTDAGMIKVASPDIRSHLQPTKRRHRTSEPVTLSIEPVMQHLEEVVVESIFEEKPGDDGMGVLVYRLGQGMSVTGPSTEGTGGYYVIVMNGAISVGEGILGPWSLVFVSPGELPPTVVAGDQGAEVMVTIFPARDPWMQALGVG